MAYHHFLITIAIKFVGHSMISPIFRQTQFYILSYHVDIMSYHVISHSTTHMGCMK